MAEMTKNELIADLARDVLTEHAPKEMAMFRARSNAYFKDPERVMKSKDAKDEMLGFGTEIVTPIMTPAVLAMATAIVNFVVASIKDPIKDETKGFLSDTIKKIFGKLRDTQQDGKGKDSKTTSKKKPMEAASYTPDQLKQIRKTAIQIAKRQGLADRTAEMLADALLGKLALS